MLAENDITCPPEAWLKTISPFAHRSNTVDWQSYLVEHYSLNRHHPQSPFFSPEYFSEYVTDVYTSVTRVSTSSSEALAITTGAIHKHEKEFGFNCSSELRVLTKEVPNHIFTNNSGQPRWRKYLLDVDTKASITNALCSYQPTSDWMNSIPSNAAVIVETVNHMYAVSHNMSLLFGTTPTLTHDASKLHPEPLYQLALQFWPRQPVLDSSEQMLLAFARS